MDELSRIYSCVQPHRRVLGRVIRCRQSPSVILQRSSLSRKEVVLRDHLSTRSRGRSRRFTGDIGPARDEWGTDVMFDLSEPRLPFSANSVHAASHSRARAFHQIRPQTLRRRPLIQTAMHRELDPSAYFPPYTQFLTPMSHFVSGAGSGKT